MSKSYHGLDGDCARQDAGSKVSRTSTSITIISLLADDRLLDLMYTGLAESNSRLVCVADDQCLKFCDDTPSVVMPRTK